MKRKQISTALFLSVFVISACQMGNSNQMSKSQQEQMKSTFDAMEESYQQLVETYQQDSTTMLDDLRLLYQNMQAMHQKMRQNHNHMMTNHQRGMRQNADDQNEMMERHMHQRVQDQMSHEWYKQMQGMHRQMALEQSINENKQIAKQHRQLVKKFKKLTNLAPKQPDNKEQPVNKKGEPSLLNSANLYSQHCSSCHGADGQGVGQHFPPVVNSKWITQDKSVPVRIILNGLRGEIEVHGNIYEGTMPSFKARLSLAEMTAIINYLREMSEGDYPRITQEDMIRISDTYLNRNEPWQPDEILGE